MIDEHDGSMMTRRIEFNDRWIDRWIDRWAGRGLSVRPSVRPSVCLSVYLSVCLQVRRLIVLVDTLYEHKVRLVVLAAAPPLEIFPEGTTKPVSSSSSSSEASSTEDAEAAAAGAMGLGGNQGDLIGDSTYLQKNVRRFACLPACLLACLPACLRPRP